jgi:hypothetical protein
LKEARAMIATLKMGRCKIRQRYEKWSYPWAKFHVAA